MNEMNTETRTSPFTSEDEDTRPVPEGFERMEDFLTHIREEFDADIGFDRKNRDAALDDLKFIAGEQWDPAVLADRESKGRPCLTINVLPQFIGQVIGDRRINKTTVKIRPKHGGSLEQAEVRSGIIKGIEAYSRAERVYDAACEDQTSCGISNIRIDLDYADNDVFDQDIYIRHIHNPFAVVWDRMSVDETGRDADHCFVQDTMPRKKYEKQYPDHPVPSDLGDQLGANLANGWVDQDTVRVTEYWRLIRKQRTLALMADGDVKDVTDMAEEEYADQLWRDETTGKTRVRKADRTYAEMYLVTGFAVLDGPYTIPLTRLPVVRVEGRVVRVGEERVRYSLIRWAKDPQRLKNYWRSLSAETLALAPRSVWVAPEDAVEGREDDFRDSAKSGDPLLVYNKSASGPPTRMEPPRLNAAALQESNQNQQDIKDTTGLHDASMGIRSNEISGRAIQARQREGDVATIIYHDNLNNAIQETGDVVNQLIPIAYDTMRTLLVIGPDDKPKLMKINDPNDEDSPDITSGKYDTSIETGPSFTTQRLESADAMMQAIQVAPQLMEVAGDLIVKAQDWPGAQEISDRLKRAMPPQITEDPENPTEPTPQQMQEQMMAAAAQEAAMKEQNAQLEHAEAMRQVELAQGSAKLEEAKADLALKAVALENAKVGLDEAEQNALRAAQNSRRAKADADKAEADAHRADTEAAVAPAEAAQRMHLAATTAAAKAHPVSRGGGPRPAAGRSKKGRKDDQG